MKDKEKKDLSDNLVFEAKISKKAFEDKIIKTYGHIQSRKQFDEHAKKWLYLYYSEVLDLINDRLSSHIGTWIGGSGWILKGGHSLYEKLIEDTLNSGKGWDAFVKEVPKSHVVARDPKNQEEFKRKQKIAFEANSESRDESDIFEWLSLYGKNQMYCDVLYLSKSPEE